jgi:hypothetical protein
MKLKGCALATEQVTVSDFTGAPLGSDRWRIVVRKHSLTREPKQLDGAPDEIGPLFEAALPTTELEIYRPGQDQPELLTVDEADFAARFTRMPVEQALAEAEPAKAHGKPRRNGKGIDYRILPHAGMPHTGRVTEAEQQTVRTHLADVNTNRAAAGYPPIDPSAQADAQRYGFTSPDTTNGQS